MGILHVFGPVEIDGAWFDDDLSKFDADLMRFDKNSMAHIVAQKNDKIHRNRIKSAKKWEMAILTYLINFAETWHIWLYLAEISRILG